MCASSLRRRNALWLALRMAEPGSESFEETLQELSELTGWDRPRILAGLGLTEEEGQGAVRPDETEPI